MIKNQVDVTAVVQPRQANVCGGQSEKEKYIPHIDINK
jgi:hypothetical protein